LLEDGTGGRLAGQARVHDGQGTGDLLVSAQDELGLAVEGLLEAVQHVVELLGEAGDVITAMNGQAVSSFAEMRAKIATSGAGKQIELTYLRDGKSNTAKVTLQSDDQTQTTANSLLPALDGAELNNYDEKGVKGVSIGKIKPNSLAEQRGLKNGDVIIGINRQKVENLGQLRKALDSKPSAIALNIIRGDSNFYLLVQ